MGESIADFPVEGKLSRLKTRWKPG